MEIILKINNDDAKLFLTAALKIDAKDLTEEALEKKTKEVLLNGFYKTVGEAMLGAEVSRLTQEIRGVIANKVKVAMEVENDGAE